MSQPAPWRSRFAPAAVIQTKSGETANPEDYSALHAAVERTGGGQPLPEALRRKMERVFGADFSAVRIHVGPQAAAIGALAFTRGTDIFFSPGQYDPESRRGQELLGHELAHVVQQARGRVRPTTRARGVTIDESSALEREADELGARAAATAGAGAQDRAASSPDGGSPAEVAARMGPGEAMPMAIATRFGAAMDDDFSDVRLHTSGEAAQLARAMGASAITVGRDIAFAAGRYQPGTVAGDALLAHELAHVQQQRGTESGSSTSKPGAAHEQDADAAAVGVVQRLWSSGKQLAGRARAALTSGLGVSLSSCGETTPSVPIATFSDPAPPAATPEDGRVATSRSSFQSNNNLSASVVNHIDAALRAAAGSNHELLMEFYNHYSSHSFTLETFDSAESGYVALTRAGSTRFDIQDFNSLDLVGLGSTLLHELAHTQQRYGSFAPPPTAEAFGYGVDMFFAAYGVGTLQRRSSGTDDRLTVAASYLEATAQFPAQEFDRRRNTTFGCLRALYIVIDRNPSPAPWMNDASAPAFLRTLTPQQARQLSAQFVHSGGEGLSGDLQALWDWVHANNPIYLSVSGLFPPTEHAQDAGTDAGPDAGRDAGRGRPRRRRGGAATTRP